MKAKWYKTSLEKPRMLMHVFTEHNAQMKALIGQEFSPLTFERYETSFRHTLEFMKWKYQIEDIDIKQLNYEFISNYEFWLKSVRKCDHNTTVKYLSNFKKIVHICIKHGWLDNDPFVGFKMTKRKVERPFLVEEELNRIFNEDFKMPRLRDPRYRGISAWQVMISASKISVFSFSRTWLFFRFSCANWKSSGCAPL